MPWCFITSVECWVGLILLNRAILARLECFPGHSLESGGSYKPLGSRSWGAKFLDNFLPGGRGGT